MAATDAHVTPRHTSIRNHKELISIRENFTEMQVDARPSGKETSGFLAR